MTYSIGTLEFATKEAITKRCQEIRDRTPDGEYVTSDDFDFFVALFKNHDEWHEKAFPDVETISTQTTEHGNRGFILNRTDGTPIDISFPHAIKLIPSSRSAKLTPQGLLDYKAAARTAVQDQVRDFRDLSLSTEPTCPIIDIPLVRGNCDVHYPPPHTFEALLLSFTLQHGISPLKVIVDSCGTVAKFHDNSICAAWSAYHRKNAILQLVSTEGRRSLPKSPTDWNAAL